MRAPYFVGTESSPIRFSIEVNNTKTILVQTKIGEELAWVGRPFSTDSDDMCKVALVIGANGSIPYGPALNFIVDGGSPKKGAMRTKEQYDAARQMLQRGFMHHVTAFYSAEQREADWQELGEDLGNWLAQRGFTVVTGSPSDVDTMQYALLGLDAELVSLLNFHGLVAMPNFERLLSQKVPQGFAQIVEGVWEQTSEAIAVTNRLTAGEVTAMKLCGKRFERVSQKKAA